jgi:hypothetical protein
MRGMLFAVMVLASLQLLSQECACKEKLQFIKTQIESNYAGFYDKVTIMNSKSYEDFSERQMRKAVKAENNAACMMVLHEWMDFFKDGHIQMRGGQGLDGPDAEAERIKNRK